MYTGGSLPVTGLAAVSLGGVTVAYPLLAAGVAILLIGAGIVLRFTGRRKALTNA